MFSPNVLEVLSNLEKVPLTQKEYETVAVMMLRVLTSWKKTNEINGVVHSESYSFKTGGKQ